MTYNVFGGTLSVTQSINLSCVWYYQQASHPTITATAVVVIVCNAVVDDIVETRTSSAVWSSGESSWRTAAAAGCSRCRTTAATAAAAATWYNILHRRIHGCWLSGHTRIHRLHTGIHRVHSRSFIRRRSRTVAAVSGCCITASGVVLRWSDSISE